MKKILLLLACSLTVITFAQTNPAKDEQAKKEKERKFYMHHKIKEVDWYSFKNENDTLTDKTPTWHSYYNKAGNLVKNMQTPAMGKNAAMPATYNLDYDKNGNLIKEYGLNFMNAYSYEYDNNGRLIKKLQRPLLMPAYVNNSVGYKATIYDYDKHDNRIHEVKYNTAGDLELMTEYVYNDKDELIRNNFAHEIKEGVFICSEYAKHTYTKSADGLTDLVSYYDMRDSLLKQTEYDYDKRGNQLKGFQITKGNKQEVLNFKYNDKDQPVESKGDPDDGPLHLFYTYNNEGLLVEIKKYGLDATTGEEKLTGVEKLVYKKY